MEVLTLIVIGSMLMVNGVFAAYEMALASVSRARLHELKAALAVARSARLIGAHEEKIVLSAAQFPTRAIGEIMLPAGAISMLPASASLEEALVRAHLDLHTRFPVCETDADPQTICGYANFKDIMSALKMDSDDRGVRSILRAIKTLDESTSIATALGAMIKERVHIAIVRGQNQQVLGMITLEDIMEELVGEIEDEFDRLPTHVHAAGSGWIFGGAVTMPVVASTGGLSWSAQAADLRPPTLAEWCAKRLEGEPKGGDTIHAEGLCVTVRKLRRGKVYEAFVTRRQPQDSIGNSG